MEKSAVFFDIDGTLWDYNNYIPDSCREGIKKLRENGHLAFICSGRSRAFIQNEDLLSLGFDGIVCACGCHIEIDGKLLYEKVIDESFTQKTIEETVDLFYRKVREIIG